MYTFKLLTVAIIEGTYQFNTFVLVFFFFVFAVIPSEFG